MSSITRGAAGVEFLDPRPPVRRRANREHRRRVLVDHPRRICAEAVSALLAAAAGDILICCFQALVAPATAEAERRERGEAVRTSFRRARCKWLVPRRRRHPNAGDSRMSDLATPTSESVPPAESASWWQRHGRRVWLGARVALALVVVLFVAWRFLLAPVAVSAAHAGDRDGRGGGHGHRDARSAGLGDRRAEDRRADRRAWRPTRATG